MAAAPPGHNSTRASAKQCTAKAGKPSMQAGAAPCAWHGKHAAMPAGAVVPGTRAAMPAGSAGQQRHVWRACSICTRVCALSACTLRMCRFREGGGCVAAPLRSASSGHTIARCLGMYYLSREACDTGSRNIGRAPQHDVPQQQWQHQPEQRPASRAQLAQNTHAPLASAAAS